MKVWRDSSVLSSFQVWMCNHECDQDQKHQERKRVAASQRTSTELEVDCLSKVKLNTTKAFVLTAQRWIWNRTYFPTCIPLNCFNMLLWQTKHRHFLWTWSLKNIYLNDIDIPVGTRVWLPTVMWRHRLADDVVQVKTVWFQTLLLLLMETLQIVDCRACPTATTASVYIYDILCS